MRHGLATVFMLQMDSTLDYCIALGMDVWMGDTPAYT
jgi:hypothetical protein